MTIKRRGRGKVATPIQNLCSKICLGEITETEFKAGMRKICQETSPLHVIGMALERSAREYCPEKVDYLWKLTDEVDPKIRDAFEQYKSAFFGDDNCHG